MEYITNYKNGDWVYGLISKPYCGRFPKLPAEMTNTNGVSGIEVDYTTIGEYTGLTDRNGVKIFEGDLIKNSAGEVGRVSWYPEHLAFMIYRKNPPTVFYMAGNDFSEIEVIGNIHDNPELLEGEENG